jgi:hypothetical protein
VWRFHILEFELIGAKYVSDLNQLLAGNPQVRRAHVSHWTAKAPLKQPERLFRVEGHGACQGGCRFAHAASD